MNFKFFYDYLKILVIDGQNWQYKDIHENGEKPKYYFSLIQIINLIVSTVLVITIPTGVSKDFSGYIISSLSIFVGLNMSVIINVFDKYLSTKVPDEKTPIWDVQSFKVKKNFSLQFIATSSYVIANAILTIVLLSMPFIINKLVFDFNDLDFVTSFEELDKKAIELFFKGALLAFYRITIYYFLFNLILLVLYGITSYYSYIKTEINNHYSNMKQ